MNPSPKVTPALSRLLTPAVARSLPVGAFVGGAGAAWYLRQADFPLDALPGRMLGVATAANLDIASRAALHWKVLGIFVLLLALASLLLRLLKVFSEPHHRAEARMMLVLGITGLASLMAMPWIPQSWPMAGFHLLLLALLLLGTLLKRWLLPAVLRARAAEEFYLPLLLTGLGLGLLLMMVVAMSTGAHPRWIWMGLPFLLLPLGMLAFARWPGRWPLWAWTAAPLTLLPALPFFAVELFFDLNKLGHYQVGAGHCLGILLGGLALWVALRPLLLRRRRRRILSKGGWMQAAYYPRAIVAIAAICYLPGFLVIDKETFEQASNCLPVSEFHAFGRVPILELLPPHLLSDFLGGFVQSLLTGGPEGNDFLAANTFTFHLVGLMGVYVTSRLVLRNAHLSFAFVALMPAAISIIPIHFSIGGAGVALLLHGLRPGAKWWQHFLMMGGIIAMVLWKLDVGYPVLLSLGVIWVMDLLTGRQMVLRWRPFLLAAGIWVLVLAGLAGTLGLVRGVNPVHNALMALQYYVSEQSYGYTTLGDTNLMNYRAQFFLFLGATLLMLLMLLVRMRRGGGKPQALALAYLMLFFLFNFQRGLVRHNFLENWDELVHCFFYVAAAGFAWWMARRWTLPARWALFCGVGLSLLLFTKYPNVEVDRFPATTDYLLRHAEAYQPPRADGKWLPRCVAPPGQTPPAESQIVTFLKSELGRNQSFLDFSNQPMLYHYTRRSVPSYFAQIPAMLHNDVLQQDFLEHIQDKDLPVAIFVGDADNPHTNMLDGVLNRFRHYRIAEHIYRNYQPWGVIEKNVIWIRKGYQPKWGLPPEDHYGGSSRFEEMYVGLIPHLWAKHDKQYQQIGPGQALHSPEDSLLQPTNTTHFLAVPANLDRSKGNYLELELLSTLAEPAMGSVGLMNAATRADQGEMFFTIPVSGQAQRHAFRISASQFWHHPPTQLLRVTVPAPTDKGTVTLIQAQIKPGD